MADTQYLPLAEPLTLPEATDPPTPHLPWLNANLIPRPPLRLEGLAGSPPIALPYDFPLEEVACLPVCRVVLDARRLGYAVMPPLLTATPTPGDLTTTIVAGSSKPVGTLSGMTPPTTPN